MTWYTNDEPNVEEDEFIKYFNERPREHLDAKMVQAARQEEVTFMKKIALYEEAEESEAWAVTGKPPITTNWVVVNKGSGESPDIRCRLVSRDFKPKGEKTSWDIFAAMPLLEANTCY